MQRRQGLGTGIGFLPDGMAFSQTRMHPGKNAGQTNLYRRPDTTPHAVRPCAST